MYNWFGSIWPSDWSYKIKSLDLFSLTAREDNLTPSCLKWGGLGRGGEIGSMTYSIGVDKPIDSLILVEYLRFKTYTVYEARRLILFLPQKLFC